MANKIGIVLALDGEREFTQGMKNAQQSAKLCDQELKNLNKEYAGQANTLEALAKKQETLKSKQEAYNRTLEEAKKGQKNAVDNYKKAGERLEELKNDLDKAKKAMEDMEKAGDTSSKAYRDQARAVEDLENAVRKQSEEQSKASGNITKWDTAVAKAKGDVEQTNRALDKNSQYLDEATKSADGCATSIDKMGKEASGAAGEIDKVSISLGDMVKAKAVDLAGDALSKLGQKAIEAAQYVIEVGSEFEASMSKVQALSGASEEQMEQMSQKAQELGSSTKFSASEVADGFSYMALAGWDAQQSIAAIEGIVNLAAASEMDLAEASDMVTDYLSAFGMEASEAGKMADMMAFAQANSNTSTRQLGEAFGNCAANMNAAGQDIQTTTSFLEAFANQGIKGSEAGTKLSAIMRDITAKMQDGAIQIGNTSVAVMDSEGNFRDLTDIMADVEAATAGMGTAERSAALSTTFTSRSVGGLNMILAEGVDKIAGYEEKLNNCDGAASNMAATMQNNLQGAITEMNSAAEGLGIALYDKGSGPLTDAVRLATELLSGITDAITPEKTELQSFIEEIEASNKSVQALIDSASQHQAEGQSQISNLEAYKNVLLELNGIEQLDEYQKYQMKNAVEALSGVIPQLSENFDAETSSLSLTNQELSDMFENAEALAMQTALIAAQKDSYDALAQATINKAKADAAVTAATNELTEANKRNEESADYLSGGYGEFYKEVLDASTALDDATKLQETANEQMETARAEIDNTKVALDPLIEQYGNLTEKTQEVGESEEGMAESMDGAAASVDNAADSLGEFSEAEEAASLSAEEAQERIKDAHEQTADAIAEAYESAKESAEKAFEVNPFDTWEVNEENGIGKFQEALDSQIEGITQYAENLDVVRENLGKTSPQLLAYIEDMGTDGAQLVKELADAFDPKNGDPKKAEDLINSFLTYLDAQDSISTVLAADKVAIESGLKELGSSDAEFAELGATIGKAFQDLEPEIASQLGNAVRQAKEMGIKIPEGLQEGIESGKIDAGQVLNELQSAMTGQLEALVEVARERGVAVDEALVDGIENGTADPVEAFTQLVNSISGQDIDVSGMTDAVSESMSTAMQDAAANAEQAAADTANVGEALAAETVSGIEGKAGEVASAAESMAQDAANAAKDQIQAWREAGEQSASEYASGILSGATTASSNAATMVQTALITANGQTSGFYSVGQNIGQGVSNGIQSMVQQVANQAANMVRSAMAAAKQAGGIQSPSKKFRDEVGKQIGAGVAFGIKQSTKQVEAEAEAQMGKTLNAMRKWLSKNKAGAGDIAYAWQALASRELKNNFGILDYTTKKNNKTGEVTKTQKTDEAYYGEVLQAARQYLSNIQSLYDVTEKEELSYWKKVANNLKAGTEAWYTAQSQIKRLRKSISDDAKAEKEKAKQEAAEAKAEAKKAAAEAAEEKKRAAEELAAKTGNYSVASDLLDTYTIYNELSERETVEYWDRIRKQFKTGTEDRIKADKQYYAAKRSYDRQLEAEEKSHAEKVKEIQDDLAADRLEVEKDLAESLSELNKQLAEDIEEANEDLAKSIDSLTKELEKEVGTLQDELGKGVNDLNASYENAVNSRYNSIMGAFNFSEAFESMSATGEDLLFNMESQAAGYEDWMKTVEQLRARGILSDALMAQLVDKGPKETAAIHALLSLTDEELKRYQAAYDRKSTAAMEQATKDNASLKKQVSADIAALKIETAAKIEAAKASNAAKIKELKDSNAVKVNELKASNAAKANELKTTASTKLASLEKTASDKLAELNKQHGQKLDTLNGTVNGVSVAVRSGLVALSGDISKLTEDNVGKITAAIANIDLNATNEANKTGNTASAAKTAEVAAKTVISPKPKQTDRIKSLEGQINTLNDQITAIERNAQDARRRGSTGEAADYNGQITSLRAQRDALVKELTNLKNSSGHRGGTRSVLGSGLDWIHENEIWINANADAMAVPFTSGDAVIPAGLTDNLFKWGAINPDRLASGAEMNRMLSSGYAPGRQAQQDTQLLEQMIGIMSEMLPFIQAKQNIYLDSGQLVGGTVEGTSNELAMRQRRRRL